MAWQQGGWPALPAAPARAADVCMPFAPDNTGCLARCLIWSTTDFARSGGQNPGYTCSDVSLREARGQAVAATLPDDLPHRAYRSSRPGCDTRGMHEHDPGEVDQDAGTHRHSGPPARPHPLVELQATFGNRAVSTLVSEARSL